VLWLREVCILLQAGCRKALEEGHPSSLQMMKSVRISALKMHEWNVFVHSTRVAPRGIIPVPFLGIGALFFYNLI